MLRRPFGRLPNEVFRYRKHNQVAIDGLVAGLERPRRYGKPVVADIGPWGAPPQDYVPPPAQSYEPHPGFAQFAEPEYDTEHAAANMHHTTPDLRLDPPLLPDAAPAVPSYDALPMTDDLLARALEDIALQAEPEPVPLCQDVTANEIVRAPDALDSTLGQSVPEPIQEIEAAFDQQMRDAAEAFEPPQPDLSLYVLQDDYLQMHEEQMYQLMDPFGAPGMGPMGPGPLGPTPGPGPMM